MAKMYNLTGGTAFDLLRMGDFITIIARAQDYALYSSLMSGLDADVREKYYKQALEWFDFVIERNPLFSHDAYLGKIYALYLKGDVNQARYVYDEMKKNENTDEFNPLTRLFS
ncbi:MAG: hypothetical protein JW776_05645 [Candidatus Lokiarchaeota archaeon]|nr:hypothetical protein [Candidatus Lokiarchaeota archaeon]